MNNLENFTPIKDNIASEFGLITAAVYGVVWRYAQMEDDVCRASLQTMGEKLGTNKATVMRHIKQLCEAGWLVDLDPGKRNSCHRYLANEHKVLQSATVQAQSVAECNATVAECNATVAECNKSVAESKLKRQETIKDTTKEKKSQNGKAPIGNQKELYDMFIAFTEIMKIDTDMISAGTKKGLFSAGKKMIAKEFGPQDLEDFGRWWSAYDWRGKQGQPPTLKQIRDMWGQFRESQKAITVDLAAKQYKGTRVLG